MRRALAIAVVVIAAAATVPGQALATNDSAQNAVGGLSSKWFSGTDLQQSGQNCSVLGQPYSETMVSAIAGYGGTGNIVQVGQRYYANVLISIPGDPCGPGSSVVGTDLLLPHGTSVDTSAPIRCFGEPRGGSLGELTGGNWSFNGSSGPYCPTQVGPSLTGTSGAVGVGFRPLATGQLYELFVPIKSTQVLVGAGANPADQITWILSTSGTYETTGSTSVWTNVVQSGGSNTPYIYFARNPSVQPYWVDNPSDGGPNSRVEFFVNLYSAGDTGTFCFDLYQPDAAHDSNPTRCTDLGNWNGTVTAAGDTWQEFGNGPNGGFALGFTDPGPQAFTMHWRFTPSSGPVVSKDVTFTTLAGPDTDGDGVPDSTDACPSVKGTQANGCQPPVPDPDGDGVAGTADKCPTVNGGGSPDGCPVVIPPVTTTSTMPIIPPPPPIIARATFTRHRASAALKGSIIVVTTGLSAACPAGAPTACPVSLAATISGAQTTARAAKAKKKAKPKPLAVGSVHTSVAAGKSAAITFKLSSRAAGLLKHRKHLTIGLTGSTTASITISEPPARKHKHR